MNRSYFKASESYVVHGFQAFYYELLRQKEKALSHYSSITSNDPDLQNEEETKNDYPSSEVEGLIVSIQKKILQVIENITGNIEAKTHLSEIRINEIKYIMIVLVDEIFINIRWEGARFWRFSLLEKQVFQSEIAGEKFFEMLNEAISNVSGNNNDVFFLYLMSISLGFKGKYRDLDEQDDLRWYKDRLYSILHNKPAKLFYPGRAKVIEECYDYTYSNMDNQSALPDINFWNWTIITIIFIYIVISYVIWFSMTDQIKDILNVIFEQARKGPLV